MTLNLGNSLFPGLNDKGGIMICGYEWGHSKDDQLRAASGDAPVINPNAITTFSNKTAAHGDKALSWPYDRRIIKWFELWGHPLSREGLGGRFEKCIVQTNWCDTQAHHLAKGYRQKLLDPEQVKNFILHVEKLRPKLIMFMGSVLIDVLQSEQAMKPFMEIAGIETIKLDKIQKDFQGRRFKIGFQSFENCDVVSLPHPSSARGLSDDYMALFREEIGGMIDEVRKSKQA